MESLDIHEDEQFQHNKEANAVSCVTAGYNSSRRSVSSTRDLEEAQWTGAKAGESISRSTNDETAGLFNTMLIEFGAWVTMVDMAKDERPEQISVVV